MVTPISIARRLGRWALFGAYGHSRVFARIFERRYWGDVESVSGKGSRLAATQNIRAELPRLFEQFGIRSVFDAPCGDFHWMREVLPSTRVRYIGGDIVPDLVELARRNAGGLDASFVVHDIVEQPLPDVDLWICRDCLFHLSFRHIRPTTLRGFVG